MVTKNVTGGPFKGNFSIFFCVYMLRISGPVTECTVLLAFMKL